MQVRQASLAFGFSLLIAVWAAYGISRGLPMDLILRHVRSRDGFNDTMTRLMRGNPWTITGFSLLSRLFRTSLMIIDSYGLKLLS